MYEDNPNHIYKMALVKARRGEVGSSAYVIRIQGRFIEIPVDVYKMIGQTKEKMNYTERDIEEMIKKLNRSNFRVNQNLQAAQSSLPPTQTNLKNPFTNARP
jgi:hypothetical protein